VIEKYNHKAFIRKLKIRVSVVRFRPWPPSTEVYSGLQSSTPLRKNSGRTAVVPTSARFAVYIRLSASTHSDRPDGVTFRESQGAVLCIAERGAVRAVRHFTNRQLRDSVFTKLRARLRSHPPSSAQPCR
jgi:hypothetical protein